MSKSQKIIIGVLVTLATVIFCALGVGVVLLVMRTPEAEPAPTAVAQRSPPPPEPTATPLPPANDDLDEVITEFTETPTSTATTTPTNTRVVHDTATPTSPKVANSTTAPTNPTIPPQIEATQTQDDVGEGPTAGPTTEWSRYDSSQNDLAVDYPITANEILEDRGVVQYQAKEVRLAQGAIEKPIVMLHFYHKDSGDLPEDVDRSDPVAMVTAMKDIYLMGLEDQLHEIQPPQAASFNGYSGAKTVVNRIDPGKTDIFGPVDIVFYFAIINHKDRIVRVQIQARKHDGGELIPVYAERILNSLELR